MSRLVNLVNERINDPTAADFERAIEQIIADLYELSSAERYALGVEDSSANYHAQ